MDKKYIETFIKKYSLGGAIEEVRWVSDNNNLVTTAMTSDRKLFCAVTLEKGGTWFKDVEIAIKDTSKLKKMLATLSESMSLKLDIDENDPTRVRKIIGENADGKVTFDYVTADLSTLDGVPKMKNIPSFNVEMILSEDFINTYNLAFSSLGDDATSFTLIMSKKKQKMEMVLGYKQNMSDRVVLEVAAVAGKDIVKAPISFDAKLLKEILSANNEVKNPVLSVSEDGLASITFDQDGFKSQYYMIKIDVED
jgi:hypothetical protein